MPAGEIITHGGRRCTKVRKRGHDAASIFQATSTTGGSGPQATTSLTQAPLPTSSDVDGELPESFITSSTLSAPTSVPVSSANTTAVIALETLTTLSDNASLELSSSSSTKGSGLNLSTGSGNPRPSFHPMLTPDGSTADTGGGSTPDGDGVERADSQNPAAIAGGIIVAVVLIVMIVVTWTYIRRRRRKQRLTGSPTNISSNNYSAAAAEAEKLSDDDPGSIRAAQLPATASYSTFATNRGEIPDASEVRDSCAPLVHTEGRPSSQYLESALIAESQPPPSSAGIGGYAAGIFGKFRRLFPSSSAAKTQEGYLPPALQVSSASSCYIERTNGPMSQRRSSDSALPHPKSRDAPMPKMLNPFADPASTNGIQRSPGFWRSPLARNPFEDPAPPDEDFPFPSPQEASHPSASRRQYHESSSSSVIVLPSSARESVRSVSLDATASEISRWRRERDSRVSGRSDPFDLERKVSGRSDNDKRTTANNTARSSQHLAP